MLFYAAELFAVCLRTGPSYTVSETAESEFRYFRRSSCRERVFF